jgi:hypothetical protein
MKALIDPQTTNIKYIKEWVANPSEIYPPVIPVYDVYPNSERVCEVQETPFQVALPLFWTDCPSNCVADQWYYDSVNKICKKIENAIPPQ